MTYQNRACLMYTQHVHVTDFQVIHASAAVVADVTAGAVEATLVAFCWLFAAAMHKQAESSITCAACVNVLCLLPLMSCRKSGKKATACTFSADSKHVFFSDRFGDVLVATALPAVAAAADAPAAAAADSAADGSSGADGPAAVEASLLLGHLQSIVTSLARCSSSSGQQLLLSTDKDGKVRASVLPANPAKVRPAAV